MFTGYTNFNIHISLTPACVLVPFQYIYDTVVSYSKRKEKKKKHSDYLQVSYASYLLLYFFVSLI